MKHDVSQYNEARKIALDHTDIASRYRAGATVAEIAGQFGISVQPVKRVLREVGVEMRNACVRPGRGSGEKNPAWRGGRYVRPDGYVTVWTPDGQRLEHRIVIEQHLGRPLAESEVIHHRDGNPSNNVIENLELIPTQADHMRKHGTQNREALLRYGLKQCTLCQLILPLSEFYSTKYNAMGIQSSCKKCKNQRDSERRRRKKDRSSSAET